MEVDMHEKRKLKLEIISNIKKALATQHKEALLIVIGKWTALQQQLKPIEMQVMLFYKGQHVLAITDS